MVKVLFMGMAAASLLGCSQSGGGPGIVNKEPTEEEMAMIEEYLMTLEVLNDYSEGEEISYYDSETDTTCYDSLAAARYYEWINELEGIDKWSGTEYLSEEMSRQNVLDSFVVVEDVLLHGGGVTTDRLGNYSGIRYWTDWNYDRDGKVVSIVNESNMAWLDQIEETSFYNSCEESRWMSYDANGNHVETKYANYKDGDASYISTPEYDSEGKLVANMFEVTSIMIIILHIATMIKIVLRKLNV